MKWSDKLREWGNGTVLKYPKRCKKSFYYETSFITKSMKEEYKEKFIENEYLDKMKQNYKPFIKYILKSKNKYVMSFMNLSRKTLLVVPFPRKNKKYTTLKDFIDNASQLQQKKFWKKSAKLIKKMLKKHNKLWVSTHGTGVPYLHLRIEPFPVYYKTKAFI